ncbi:MAG: CDP-glucose 4,6-dehydratase [Alphaproteobacteria bacterium]|jgi:CDP-glucose 4,6-dehydratase
MKTNMNSYWFNKNVLITGINGFIGGSLAKKLIENGANVFGILRNNNQDTFLYYEKINKQVVLINGDILDTYFIARIIAEEQINNIFHLAAQVEVGVGLANPYLTFENNIKGTYSLLEAIRQNSQSIESVVIASTDKSYGSYPKDKMPYKEDYPLRPIYPYDVSKACADMIAQSYASEVYELPIVVTRFCNIFGPGQLNFSAVFPDSIRACLGYGEFVPRGNGQQIRDFIFIDDVVDLYLRIGEKLALSPEKFRGEVYNAGTNAPISVRKVLETVYQLTNKEVEFDMVLEVMKTKETFGEIDCQYMDYEKVNKHFGWSPSHTFHEGVVKTIDWFQGYLKNKHE